MYRTLIPAIALSLVAGCASDGDECNLNSLYRGNDGLYSGYEDCSSAHYPDFSHPTQRWDGSYEVGCANTTGEDAFACAEQTYWQVFQFDHDQRVTGYDTILAIATREEAAGTLGPERLAILYTRLGVLGTAIAMENEDFSRAQDLLAHLQKAHDLQPDNVFIESWLLTIEVGQNVFLDGDWESALLRLEELYDEEPQIVAGAFATVGSGRPMDSGWPQKAAVIVDGIEELGCGKFCGWDANRAPFTGPGSYFTYSEVTARVGDRDRTQFWLRKALDHEMAATWPLRQLAQDSLDDLDGYIGKFTERGDDEDVSDMFVTSNANSCMICHAPLPTN